LALGRRSERAGKGWLDDGVLVCWRYAGGSGGDAKGLEERAKIEDVGCWDRVRDRVRVSTFN
jgi:hypothetical protein